jgi:glycosyltransferase involved in cell wall biosynthesis
MKIVVDLQSLQNGSRNRGIGRYSWGIFEGIVRNCENHEIYALLNSAFDESIEVAFNRIEKIIPASNILIFSGLKHDGEADNGDSWSPVASEILRNKFIDSLGVDAVLNTSLFEGYSDCTAVGIPKNSNIVHATVLYDMIPLSNIEKYLGSNESCAWYFRKLENLKKSDVLLSISNYSKSEYHLYSPGNNLPVVNISSAIKYKLGLPNKDEINSSKKHLGITKPFVMHVSALDERKNFHGLIKAFARLPTEVRNKHQLVLVCPLDDNACSWLLAVIREAGISPNEVILTGYVEDTVLDCLYASCKLFVFPTFHEGFGLPILEAMQFSVPVIASNNSSIPEVIDMQEALFDPSSQESISSLMAKALIDDKFRERLIDNSIKRIREFSWDKSAKLAISSMEDAIDLKKNKVSQPYSFKHDLLESNLYGIATKNELEEFVKLSTKNDCAIDLIRARSNFSNPLSWRVEGPFDSTYSLALLNRETARALEELGHKVILHSTEGNGDFDASETFLEANQDLAAMHSRERQFPHAAVDVASRNLYPPRVSDMQAQINMLHHYAWEESGFPAEWVNNFNSSLHGMTTLSNHVQKIMIDNGVSIPMKISGCGVDHWERVNSDKSYVISAKSFRFLHVSSCIPRKGVDALLAAYGAAFSVNDDVELIIKTFRNIHNTTHEQISAHMKNNPNYPAVQVIEGDISESELKSLYEQCHVLVSPCKAEGFGLPFAEAMLSGLPVITTNWGGQLDFCNPSNSWLVDYDFQRADTHFNLYYSTWANPKIKDLTEAMIDAFNTSAFDRMKMASNGRRILLNEFKWIDVVARTVNTSYDLLTHEKVECKIAWITTWNTKCGIATYSQHLISNMQSANIQVYAPANQNRLSADDNSIRNWILSKDFNNFDLLSQDIEMKCQNIIYIQFNYGFFNHLELSKFINRHVSQNRKIFVELHATWDQGGHPNFDLNFISDALKQCTRVVAHTVEDLNRLKSIGLIDNVCILPHGMIEVPGDPLKSSTKTISTYGFCLPHKGLIEVANAVILLNNSGYPIKLNMINARYPANESTQISSQIRKLITDENMSDMINFDDDFHTDESCINKIRESDLVVFAYQNTGESASGAVRYGMASGVPVAITPIPIFNEMAGAVHVLPGVDVDSIANGLKFILDEIESDSEYANNIENNAKKWRMQHAYSAISTRLYNMLKSSLVNL